MLVEQLVQTPGTALYRAMAGEWAAWGDALQTNVLMTRLIWAAETANWQRGASEKDAANYVGFPPPIQLPGQEPWEPPNRETKRFGTVRKSLEDMKEWLGW